MRQWLLGSPGCPVVGGWDPSSDGGTESEVGSGSPDPGRGDSRDRFQKNFIENFSRNFTLKTINSQLR